MSPVIVAILVLLVTHVAFLWSPLIRLGVAAKTIVTVLVAAMLCVWLLSEFGIIGNSKGL